jgi:hypothetical protein
MKINSIFDESPQQKSRRDKPNPSMAFFVHVGEPELLTVNPAKLDSQFKNQLQDMNL